MLVLAAAVSSGCGTSSATDGEGARALVASEIEPDVPAPSADNPVTVGAWVRPGVLNAGEAGVLVVQLRVAGGHHLYASDKAGALTGTSVRMEEGGVVRAAGEWVGPAVAADGFLTGVVEFRRAVRVAEGAPAGKGEVECAVTFQACTDELCWPARTEEVRARVFVKAR